jgi:hypothetical protein
MIDSTFMTETEYEIHSAQVGELENDLGTVDTWINTASRVRQPELVDDLRAERAFVFRELLETTLMEQVFLYGETESAVLYVADPLLTKLVRVDVHNNFTMPRRPETSGILKLFPLEDDAREKMEDDGYASRADVYVVRNTSRLVPGAAARKYALDHLREFFLGEQARMKTQERRRQVAWPTQEPRFDMDGVFRMLDEWGPRSCTVHRKGGVLIVEYQQGPAGRMETELRRMYPGAAFPSRNKMTN